MQDVKKDRDKYIGGSDIPVIMGLVNYGKSRWDLLREKAQLWEDDFEGNAYTEYGNVMEDIIRAYVNFSYDANFAEDVRISMMYRYHTDGYDKNTDKLLEIKTTGKVAEHSGDGIPAEYKKYLVQLLFGMVLFNTKHGMLAVYERPDDMSEEFYPTKLKCYEVDMDMYPDYMSEIESALDEFLDDLLYLKAHTDCTEQELPSCNSLVPIADKLVKLEQSIALLKDMEREYKDFKARMKTAMEQRGIKSWSFGNTKFTLVPDEEDKIVESFDEKWFAKEHPDVYEQYKIVGIKKGRAGYVRTTQKKGADNE